jgi:hypothetical protein
MVIHVAILPLPPGRARSNVCRRGGFDGPIVANAARAVCCPFATRIARLVARRLARHWDARQNGRRSIGAAGGPAPIDVLQ